MFRSSARAHCAIEQVSAAGDRRSAAASPGLSRVRQVEQSGSALTADQAREVLGALQVARQPVEVVGDAREHAQPPYRRSRCPCCPRPARS